MLADIQFLDKVPAAVGMRITSTTDPWIRKSRKLHKKSMYMRPAAIDTKATMRRCHRAIAMEATQSSTIPGIL